LAWQEIGSEEVQLDRTSSPPVEVDRYSLVLETSDFACAGGKANEALLHLLGELHPEPVQHTYSAKLVSAHPCIAAVPLEFDFESDTGFEYHHGTAAIEAALEKGDPFAADAYS